MQRTSTFFGTHLNKIKNRKFSMVLSTLLKTFKQNYFFYSFSPRISEDFVVFLFPFFPPFFPLFFFTFFHVDGAVSDHLSQPLHQGGYFCLYKHMWSKISKMNPSSLQLLFIFHCLAHIDAGNQKYTILGMHESICKRQFDERC